MKVRVYQVAHEVNRLGEDACPWSVEWQENGRRRAKTVGSKDDADCFASSGTCGPRRCGFGSSPRPSPRAQGRATQGRFGLAVALSHRSREVGWRRWPP